MRAKVNAETCIGCELCVSTCPDVFAMTDDGTATVIVDRVPAEVKNACEQAAQDCPVEAITIEQ
jgi:ferredoxin